MDWNNISLSDFCNMEITRNGDIAEIIVDYIEDEGEIKPVRLIGFSCRSDLADFEIYEEGFNYYSLLIEEIKLKLKK